MNLIRRHKGLALVLGLTLILIIVIFVIFSNMIFSNGNSVYGNRLDDIARIDKNAIDSMTDELEELEEIEKVEVRVQGKIIYTTMIFKEGTALNFAKETASGTLDKYKEEVLEDYDFGFFLKENIEESDNEEEEERTGFVVAGTKHSKNDDISWTNN